MKLLWSQGFQFAEHRRFDFISGLTHVNNRCYYLELVDYSSPHYMGMFAEELYLVGVADSAKPFLSKKLLNQARRDVMTWPYYSSRRIIKATLDKHLICYYESQKSCDQLGSERYFSKLDTSGNVVFTVTVPVIPADIIQYTDSSYYLIGGGAWRHYSKNGSYLSNHIFSGANFHSISLLNNGNFFVSSPTSFCEVDTAGNFIQVATAPTWLIKYVQSPMGAGFGLSSNGEILRCSPTYSITHQTQLTGITLHDFYYQNDSLFVVGKLNASGKPYYAILNSNLNPIYQTNTTNDGFTPMAIELSQDQHVNILGYTNVANLLRGRAFVKIPKSGDFQLQQDIGVASFTASSLSKGPGDYSYQGKFDITVKNYSNHQVNGFNLNCDFPAMICPKSWQMWFDSLIPPQGSVVVSTGSILVYGNAGANHNVNFCFFTSTPGRLPDKQIGNDLFCSSTFVPVDISEFLNQDSRANIFPNPFSSSFTVQSEFEIKEITVFNAMGLKVYSNAENGKEAVLSLEGFRAGVYFLKIETEKGTVTRKLIKN